MVLGFVETILFYVGLFPPLEICILIFWTISIVGLVKISISRFSLLPRLMIIIYSAPFSALVGYWFVQDFVWWLAPPAVVEYCQNRLLMEQMVTIGIIGLIGLLAGMYAVELFLTAPSSRDPSGSKLFTLPKSIFLIMLGMALFLSWLIAPPTTIFTTAYASGETLSSAEKMGFNAANTVSYLFLVLLFIDSERERNYTVRRLKRMAVLGVSAFIVIYLQLLRGDRESIGLIVALALLNFTSPWKTWSASGQGGIIATFKKYRKSSLKYALIAVMIISIFIGIGQLRFEVAGHNLGDMDFAKFKRLFFMGFGQNTWTGTLVSQLGVAAEYHFGPMEYLYGRTYLDYLLSLPPGIVSHYIGYERPVEANRGPGWWYNAYGDAPAYLALTTGGVMPTVVPFKNLGAVGVLLILGLYGFLIGRWELQNMSGNFWARIQYGAVATSSFLWFWYGDMSIIRGLMAAFLLGLMYKFFLHPPSVQEQLPLRGLLTQDKP